MGNDARLDCAKQVRDAVRAYKRDGETYNEFLVRAIEVHEDRGPGGCDVHTSDTLNNETTIPCDRWVRSAIVDYKSEGETNNDLLLRTLTLMELHVPEVPSIVPEGDT